MITKNEIAKLRALKEARFEAAMRRQRDLMAELEELKRQLGAVDAPPVPSRPHLIPSKCDRLSATPPPSGTGRSERRRAHSTRLSPAQAHDRWGPYRNDRDALRAHHDALERQLRDTQEELDAVRDRLGVLGPKLVPPPASTKPPWRERLLYSTATIITVALAALLIVWHYLTKL